MCVLCDAQLTHKRSNEKNGLTAVNKCLTLLYELTLINFTINHIDDRFSRIDPYFQDTQLYLIIVFLYIVLSFYLKI